MARRSGWRWLKARLGVLLFAFAFLGSAVGSTVVRDAEETGESERDTADAIVASQRRAAERAHARVPTVPRARRLARPERSTALALSPVPRSRPPAERRGLWRRVPPDGSEDDADVDV